MNSNQGGDWDDMEIKKFKNRTSKLIAQGMSEMEAEKLAERLVYRDRPVSEDDRKLCLECANWRNRCTKPAKGYCSVPTILQRCDGYTSRAA